MYDVYGILGYPVSHSLSPIMHNFWFKKYGIKAVYGAFPVKEELSAGVMGIRVLNIKGVSVTIPHKVEVMKYLDEVSREAEEIGAVNTLFWKENKLCGDNTDWKGILNSFLERGVEITGKRVVILGAGGAARAACYAMKKGGASEILIYNRTFDKAQKLAEDFGGKAFPFSEINNSEGDIFVQTTSIGMKEERSPVGEEVIRKFKVVMDVVYVPLKTRLLKIAERLGIKTIDGLSMLIYQGVEQFKIWTGITPDSEEIRKILEEVLKKENC